MAQKPLSRITYGSSRIAMNGKDFFFFISGVGEIGQPHRKKKEVFLNFFINVNWKKNTFQ